VKRSFHRPVRDWPETCGFDRTKRALDFTFALAALVLLGPLLIAIALAIWIEDRGSPLYRGQRIARGRGRFKMLKFRSMTVDGWKSGVNSTASGDRRITRVGKILRKAKLDELPQLWNVLRGEMSLVGPRPQVPADASLYTPEECFMLDARPGLTDLASIVFADEGEILEGDADPDLLYNQIVRPWKSRLVLLWLARRSLAMDLWILGLTAAALVSREWALAGVARILIRWDAEPMLCRVAWRRGPPPPWPPPGAERVVAEYRVAEHA
jgi:lipopolysaccharide/colanic/teichoic acid biosynthesis glycosyltransferase